MEPINSPIGEKITKEMWERKVSKKQKSTITSPSSRHLGHFKALIHQFAEDPETEEGKEMYNKQDDIINVYVSLLNYTLEKQYSYKWWQNIINIVIAKLLGINKIHLICILHLYEANYSLFLGLIWKELVEEFEKNNTINHGLHGGHWGHDAQTLSLIKELNHDILYSSCKSLENFDNNVASCYNHILPNVSSLASAMRIINTVKYFQYMAVDKELPPHHKHG
eukprot:15365761-Ditylum_brightwellii.AAC.1